MELEFEINYTDLELIKIIDSELTYLNDIKFEKIIQSGFDGLDIVFYLLIIPIVSCEIADKLSDDVFALGDSLVKSITNIVVKIIERNDSKSVKINGVEFKGYTEKEVSKLIKKIMFTSKDDK